MEVPTSNINENNIKACHEIFQILLHFDELRDYLLNGKLPIYEDVPIIQKLVLLLSCYDNKNRDKNCKIKNEDFLNYISKNFQNINNPIDILNIIFKLIHLYIVRSFSKDFLNQSFLKQKCEANCIIHKLFFININEYKDCKNCRNSYSLNSDPNYFIYKLNINDILTKIKKHHFTYNKISNNLFGILSMGSETCSNCKSNQLENFLIWYSTQKYFIISLNLENVEINEENLITIYCMINSQIKTQNESKEGKLDYLFKGLLLKKKKHNQYASLFYEKENDKNYFRFYYFPKNKIYENWFDIISQLIKSLIYPIAIIYENKPNEQRVFCIEENKYNELKNKFNSETTYGNTFDNVEWICNKCNKINNMFDKKCSHCSKSENNENDGKNNIENKKKIEKWKCLNCKNENLNTDNSCKKCGSNKIRILNNKINTWLCRNCQQVNKDDNENCKQCGYINNSIKKINNFLVSKINNKKNNNKEINDNNEINNINDNNEINNINDNNEINNINDNNNEMNNTNNNNNEMNDNKKEINDNNKKINDSNEMNNINDNNNEMNDNNNESNNDDNNNIMNDINNESNNEGYNNVMNDNNNESNNEGYNNEMKDNNNESNNDGHNNEMKENNNEFNNNDNNNFYLMNSEEINDNKSNEEKNNNKSKDDSDDEDSEEIKNEFNPNYFYHAKIKN